MNRQSVARKGVVEDPTIFPKHLIESTTFFAPSVPTEIKVSIKLFHSNKLTSDQINHLLSIAKQYLHDEREIIQLDKDEVYTEIEDLQIANAVLTSLFLIFRIALKNKVKISVVKKDLLAINLPAPIVESVCSELTSSRTVLEKAVVSTGRNYFHQLYKLKWRIDVAISTGQLSRVMRPHILLQMIMRDGRVATFEVSTEQFNQLRYNTAKVLYEMQALERHPIIRIVNEFKRREEEDYNN